MNPMTQPSHALFGSAKATARLLGLVPLLGVVLSMGLLLASSLAVSGSDLSLEPLVVSPMEPEEGDRIFVAAVVHNQGEKVEQVLVEGRVNNRTLLSRTIAVEADNATALSFSFKLESTVAIITVVVDPYQEVNDTDRSNNHRVHPIEVEEDEGNTGKVLVIVGLAVLAGGGVAFLYVRSTASEATAPASGERPIPRGSDKRKEREPGAKEKGAKKEEEDESEEDGATRGKEDEPVDPDDPETLEEEVEEEEEEEAERGYDDNVDNVDNVDDGLENGDGDSDGADDDDNDNDGADEVDDDIEN